MQPSSRVVHDALYLVRYYHPDVARVLDTVPVTTGPLPDACGAIYNGEWRRITINQRNEFEADSLASLLVHEGYHALDHRLGRLTFPKSTLREHVEPELRAFRVQAEFWQKLFPYGKVPARNKTDHVNNEMLEEFKTGKLDAHVEYMYGQQWYEAIAAAQREGWRFN